MKFLRYRWFSILLMVVIGAGTMLTTATRARGVSLLPNRGSTTAADGTTLSPIGFLGGVYHSVYVVGNIAYLGQGPGFVVVDMSDPTDPVMLANVFLGNRVEDILVTGDIAYLAVGDAGLYLFDIADPSNPTQIGHYPDKQASAVNVADSRAYVATGDGFVILSLSDSSAIQLLGGYPVPEEAKGYTGGIDIAGQQVYLSYTRYSDDFSVFEGILYIVDVSTPGIPSLTGNFTLPANSTADDVAVAGNIAYLSSGEYSPTEGLYTINVSDPAHPQQLDRHKASAYKLQILGNQAYVAEDSLTVIDISDPSALTETSSLDLDSQSSGLFVQDGMAYVATNRYGVRIIEVTDSGLNVQGAYQSLIWSHDVFVSDDLAYIAGRALEGLSIVDVSNPRGPRQIGHLPINGDAYRVQVEDGKAFIADAEGGALWIVDVSVPTNPTLIKEVQRPQFVHDLMVVGTTVYLANGSEGLLIYDVADPAASVEIGSYAEDQLYVEGVYIVGNVAYIADPGGQLVTVDISNPVEPQKLDEIELALPDSHRPRRIAVKDETAYLLAGDVGVGGSIRLVNVSSPQNLVLGALYETQHQVHDVAFMDDLAFLATSSPDTNGEAVKVLDISSPETPVEVASIDEGGTGLFMVGNTLYLAGGSLSILRIESHSSSIYLPTVIR